MGKIVEREFLGTPRCERAKNAIHFFTDRHFYDKINDSSKNQTSVFCIINRIFKPTKLIYILCYKQIM